ncbi:hypothetical protein VISI1226_04869 [Vibrio sinaloensis DSM 21326]|uniref:Zinc finger protein n=1 Tax=Vibrio sinaloensis DSM 21326 TaxID=945550 RepID=E8M1C8_PHOS4|nr:DUF2256 domain-containing protein [Vibrio sinaloensis]EGA72108.1 hypothetical protein VISI1226_04869 [Vibrio sinaloensis DSM 21326]
MKSERVLKGFKSQLDTKQCPVCSRTFSWRKKWKRNWHEVVYCSERCRRNKNKGAN